MVIKVPRAIKRAAAAAKQAFQVAALAAAIAITSLSTPLPAATTTNTVEHVLALEARMKLIHELGPETRALVREVPGVVGDEIINMLHEARPIVTETIKDAFVEIHNTIDEVSDRADCFSKSTSVAARSIFRLSPPQTPWTS